MGRARPRSHRLVRDIVDLGGERPGLRVFAEKQLAFQCHKGRKAPWLAAHLVKTVRKLLILRAAAPQKRDHRREKRLLPPKKHLGQQRALIKAGRQAKKIKTGVKVNGAEKSVTIPADFSRQRLKFHPRHEPRDGVQNPGIGAGRDLVDDLFAQHPRRAVIKLGKIRRDPRLDRKPAQKPRAERMDRLDLQPAGRVDSLGKQPSRLTQHRLGHRPFDAKLGQFVPQRRVRQHRPAPQPCEQPVLHLGRGGLGIGQAQDALRFGPAQKQPCDPVDQHPRLARPGIGRQPDRPGGICRLDLTQAGEVFCHPTSSGADGSLISHSPARARWS